LRPRAAQGPPLGCLQQGAPVPPCPLRWADLNVVYPPSSPSAGAAPTQTSPTTSAPLTPTSSRPCRAGAGRVAAQRTESSPTGPATRGAAQRSCWIATEEPDPPTLGPTSEPGSLPYAR
jgi:hypothetical protein